MNIVHEEKVQGLTIKIYRDDTTESPDEWGDDGLFLVGFHRQFSVERKGYSEGLVSSILNRGRYEDDSVNDEAREAMRQYHVFALEAYIHSGVSLSLANEGSFPDRQWDVSLLGAVFISKKEARTRTQSRKMAQGLIDAWNDYLSGNVYGFVIEDERGEHLESCWGFCGDYEAGALEEARISAKHYTSKEAAKERGAAHRADDIERAKNLLAPYGLKIV